MCISFILNCLGIVLCLHFISILLHTTTTMTTMVVSQPPSTTRTITTTMAMMTFLHLKPLFSISFLLLFFQIFCCFRLGFCFSYNFFFSRSLFRRFYFPKLPFAYTQTCTHHRLPHSHSFLTGCGLFVYFFPVFFAFTISSAYVRMIFFSRCSHRFGFVYLHARSLIRSRIIAVLCSCFSSSVSHSFYGVFLSFTPRMIPFFFVALFSDCIRFTISTCYMCAVQCIRVYVMISY